MLNVVAFVRVVGFSKSRYSFYLLCKFAVFCYLEEVLDFVLGSVEGATNKLERGRGE